MEMREERRVVTALFADIVGSTPLGERLGLEEYKLVMGEAVAHMVNAVEAFGGTVKDLAGDGVLALFGAPLTHEDDPERAILAGLRIVEDIEGFSAEVVRAWGVAGLGVRVGVETGPVVTGAVGAGSRVEYGAVGDVVNTAARLQSAADPGTVLVGAATRSLVEPAFTWGPVRDVTLKGKDEPLAVAAVTGVTGAQARVSLEATTPFVGRSDERARGVAAVEGALTGSGAIVFITGEPGIGKTRLTSELRAAFEGGASAKGEPRWLEGRCVSYGGSLPYGPFRDLVRSWLGVHADDPPLRVRIGLRGHLDRLFGDRAAESLPYLAALLDLEQEPDTADRLGELAPEALRFRTFEVLRTLVARLAADGPLALAIEDLHWADATSLDLLAELGRDTDVAALLLVCTSRTERDHASWRVKEDLQRTLPHRSVDIALGGLTAGAEGELLDALAGGPLPEPLRGRILASAEGNPFFLEEIVRSLVDAGAIVHDESGWRTEPTVTPEIPMTVEKVILSRIDNLPAATRDTLTAAAVLGRTFDQRLLQALREDRDVQDDLRDLMRLDLIREGRRWPEPEYRFKHALIQEAAYRTLVREDRRPAAPACRGVARGQGCRPRPRGRRAAGPPLARRRRRRPGDQVPHDRRRPRAPGVRARRGDRRTTATCSRSWSVKAAAGHGASRRSSSRSRSTCRSASPTRTDVYQRAFELWDPTGADGCGDRHAPDLSTSFLPDDPDPRSAIAWPNIQLCMQLFDRLVEQWPERTIVPSLAERWEIADDGLRYVFHLRRGAHVVRRHAAHRPRRGVRDQARPRSGDAGLVASRSTSSWSAGSSTTWARRPTRRRSGCARWTTGRWSSGSIAPAPYFLSVMNRPDGGAAAAARDRRGGRCVDRRRAGRVGRVRDRRRGTRDALVLERRPEAGRRRGNVARVEVRQMPIADATVRYRRRRARPRDRPVHATARGPDPSDHPDQHARADRPGRGTSRSATTDPIVGDAATAPGARTRGRPPALADVVAPNLVVANGGIVPPALQGHTPDIAPAVRPRPRARSLLPDPDAILSVAFLDEDRRSSSPSSRRGARSSGSDSTRGVDARRARDDGAAGRARARSTSPGGSPATPTPSTSCACSSTRQSRTNEGGFASEAFDDLIERARQERSDHGRLELFHQADRMAVADRVAVIPLVYGRSVAHREAVGRRMVGVRQDVGELRRPDGDGRVPRRAGALVDSRRWPAGASRSGHPA